jgi:hypothetical protein
MSATTQLRMYEEINRKLGIGLKTLATDYSFPSQVHLRHNGHWHLTGFIS